MVKNYLFTLKGYVLLITCYMKDAYFNISTQEIQLQHIYNLCSTLFLRIIKILFRFRQKYR